MGQVCHNCLTVEGNDIDVVPSDVLRQFHILLQAHANLIELDCLQLRNLQANKEGLRRKGSLESSPQRVFWGHMVSSMPVPNPRRLYKIELAKTNKESDGNISTVPRIPQSSAKSGGTQQEKAAAGFLCFRSRHTSETQDSTCMLGNQPVKRLSIKEESRTKTNTFSGVQEERDREFDITLSGWARNGLCPTEHALKSIGPTSSAHVQG